MAVGHVHTDDKEDREAWRYVLPKIAPCDGAHDHTTHPLCPQQDEIDICSRASLPRLDGLSHSLGPTEDRHTQGKPPGDARNVHVIDTGLVKLVVIC
jgi:hypothetical protein